MLPAVDNDGDQKYVGRLVEATTLVQYMAGQRPALQSIRPNETDFTEQSLSFQHSRASSC